MGVKVERLAIPDLCLITPEKFGDDRGFFSETYNHSAMVEAGLDVTFVQDNQSLSSKKGVLRGLHFQNPPYAQAKLVRCIRGSIWDVAVDIRKGSPTYGKWAAAEISAKNWAQIYVPRGFAHGFVTLEPMTEVIYKVDNQYDGPSDDGLAWDDADLNIDWPDTGSRLLSEKDKKQQAFVDLDSPFEYEGDVA